MSSSAVEANFQFWAIKIPKNSEKKLELKNDKYVYHVSNATLGQGVNRGRTTVFCKANGEKAAICNLMHVSIENASLDLIVSRSMNASFVTKGPNEVTISGYIQPLVEDSDSDTGSAEDKTSNEVPPETTAPEQVASETKATEVLEMETNAEPIEMETESKKRKIDEVEEVVDDTNKQQNKRNKSEDKKENQKEEATKEKDNKSANQEDAKKTTKVKVKDKALPRGDTTKKSYRKLKNGVRYRILKKGEISLTPTKKGDKITLHYIGCLKDGTQFDKNLKEGLTFKVGKGEVINGMEIGVKGMFPGEKRRIIVPPEQGYGKEGAGDGKIPPNSELHFTVQRK